MKSLATCLLLLMCLCLASVRCIQVDEDDPPLVCVNKLKLDKNDYLKIIENTYIAKEASRVAVFELKENEKYLMRIDPPEHCARVVICSVTYDDTGKEVLTDMKTCDVADHGIMLNPRGVIHKMEKNPQEFKATEIQPTEDNILISLVGREVVFKFNLRSEQKIGKVKMDESTWQRSDKNKKKTEMIRVETSSFYCNVHIATTGSPDGVVPRMLTHDTTGKYKNTYYLTPFPLGKKYPAKFVPRKYFGPLFRYCPGKNGDNVCVEDDLGPTTGGLQYTVTANKQCPFAHDRMGFSRWTKPKGNFEQTFWKGPVYHYTLKDNSCVGTPLAKPFQIDIEIGNPFDSNINYGHGRCFGFALVFGKTNNQKQLKIELSRTFEFYLVSSMFIGPDSDKIRSLRTARDSLRKIRISFFEKNKYYDNTDFAIVEYDFLNDNIAGVREYVALPQSAKDFTTVTLLSEGYCELRVLNDPDSCWKLEGCEVISFANPQ